MKYFKLVQGLKNEKLEEKMVIVEFPNEFTRNQYIFNSGDDLSDLKIEVSAKYNSNEGNILTDYLANDLGLQIVSQRLKEIIEKMERNIQFFPINIIEINEEKRISEYYVLNIVNSLNALDLGKSKGGKVKTIRGEEIVLGVKTYALNLDIIKHRNMFRLIQPSNPIFVSELFKEEIEKKEITGCIFREVII